MTSCSTTLAIPTFRRPELLRRALQSAAAQQFEGLEVLVVDNATEGDGVQRVIDAFRPLIPGLRYVRHAENIGPLRNFMYCLAQARGHYFMWLADDDELSPGALAPMVAALDRNPDAVTCVPRWRLIRERGSAGERVPQQAFVAASRLQRCARYMWRANDAFFYALHRRSVLQQCAFGDFVWPNRGNLADWSYVYLFGLVVRGPVIDAGDAAEWINHAYTEKSYARAEGFVWRNVRYAVRRLNVQALYLGQARRHLGLAACVLLLPVALASLVREAGAIALSKLVRLATRRR